MNQGISDLLNRLEDCHVTGCKIQESIQVAAHQLLCQPLLGPLPICAFVIQILPCTKSMASGMKCFLDAVSLETPPADLVDGSEKSLIYSNHISSATAANTRVTDRSREGLMNSLVQK